MATIGLLEIFTSDLLPFLLNNFSTASSLCQLELTCKTLESFLAHPSNQLWAIALGNRWYLNPIELLGTHPEFSGAQWKQLYREVLKQHEHLKPYFDLATPATSIKFICDEDETECPFGLASMLGFYLKHQVYSQDGQMAFLPAFLKGSVQPMTIDAYTQIARLAYEKKLLDNETQLGMSIVSQSAAFRDNPRIQIYEDLGFCDLLVEIFVHSKDDVRNLKLARAVLTQFGWGKNRGRFATKYGKQIIQAIKPKEEPNIKLTYYGLKILNDWARAEEGRVSLCESGFIALLAECLLIPDSKIHYISVSALLNCSNSPRKLMEFEFNGAKIYQRLLPIYHVLPTVRDRVTILMLYARLNSFCIMPENIKKLIEGFVFDTKNDEASVFFEKNRVFDPDDFTFWTMDNLEICRMLGFWALAFCPLLSRGWESVQDRIEEMFDGHKGHSNYRMVFLHTTARRVWDAKLEATKVKMQKG